jgi:hypothetical protein
VLAAEGARGSSARDNAVRRIHDAVGVDAIHFESGYRKLV